MGKKMFFGLAKPQMKYELIPTILPKSEKVTASKTVTLFHQSNANQHVATLYRPGDHVKTGQKLSLFADDPAYVIATVTGTIAAISPYTGDYGKTYFAITINRNENEILDDQFEKQIQQPTMDTAVNFLIPSPGKPPVSKFSNAEAAINTIVILGVDGDLLIGTHQYIVRSRLDDIKNGIRILRAITGIERIFLITAGESIQGVGHLGAQAKRIETTYPSAIPRLIMKNVFGQIVPAGKTCEDLGVCFMSAEAAASIGKAFESGRIPVSKTLTLVTKAGRQKVIETVIGTPIGSILETHGVAINQEDRLIFGGPMTGSAVYSLDHPIQPDTDGLIVLDRSQAAYASEYPCINCGECVRICPARMQVNMLVRFLEAGHYEEAADNYDLHSCIECGLCSYVCVSKIPIFQYIKLAKYELDRARSAEAMNV